MATILVAEDEVAIRELLVRWLMGQGYTVLTAEDGARAVALARSARPDLILMDMGLPVLNGWQATHRLKQAHDTSTIPIIALTAYVLPDERSQSFAVGCADFEPKPIDLESLRTKVLRHLASAGSAAAS